uniref:Bm11770 n=1 Tax=Brugia malayi TaxID=6279 RepID=A0A1I9GA84_BRUMA|nr:Bm11770 [Brugia malayi]
MCSCHPPYSSHSLRFKVEGEREQGLERFMAVAEKPESFGLKNRSRLEAHLKRPKTGTQHAQGCQTLRSLAGGWSLGG